MIAKFTALTSWLAVIISLSMLATAQVEASNQVVIATALLLVLAVLSSFLTLGETKE